MKQRAKVSTIWRWEHYRGGVLIDTWQDENVVTNEGLDYLLNAAFKGSTAISSWYFATYENDYTPNGGETYAVPGFTECVAIDETTRPACSLGSVLNQSVDNSANKATFTFNASKTIYGGGLMGGGTAPDTIGDTLGGGKVYCVARFSSGSKLVADDEVLKVIMELRAQDV